MNIGEKIAFHRKNKNMTQRELADGICSTAYLSKLENNKIDAQNEILSFLCERLDLDHDQITVDDFTSIMDQLRRVYVLVNKRQTQDAEPKLAAFEDLAHSINPMISTAYFIIRLEFEVAARHCENAAQFKSKLLDRLNYLNEETNVWYYKALGYYEYTYGNLERSVDYFYKAQTLIEEAGNSDPQIEYLLGLVNTRLMLISKSIYHTERALDIYTRQGYNLQKITECKLLLAINYSKVNYTELAEDHYKNLIQLLKMDYQNPNLLSKVYHNLGYLYLVTEQVGKAEEVFQDALNVSTQPDLKVDTYYLLAYIYKKQGKRDQALAFCQKCMEHPDPFQKEYFYKGYILETSILFPDFECSTFLQKLENEILPYFETQEPAVARECCALLGEIYSNQGRYKMANQYYRKAYQINALNQLKEVLI